MRKRNKSWTIGEANAYEQGYTDGIRAQKAGNPEWAPRNKTYQLNTACVTEDPDDRCDLCNCWKIFREYCS